MEQYVYEKKETGLMPENDYEVRIEKIERKTLPSGKEKLSVMFKVRDDVEQAYKNKCVFEDIWSEKENPQFFNRKRLNQLLGTQHLDDGHIFENINAIIDFLVGKCLIAHISVEFDTYHGNDVNTISYYKSSKQAPQTLGATTTPTKSTPRVDVINADDLPF